MSFSPDYFTARSRFVDAGRRAGGALRSIAIAAAGPRGELLTIDVATMGRRGASRVVIVSCGLHGAEGFAGSAIELAWLEQAGARPLPADLRVVLVHALNPFGFAWLRRTNEHNVDLNRNFLVDRSFLDGDEYRRALAIYTQSSSFLNPASPPSPLEPYTLRAIGEVITRGRRALERALPAGQYANDRGLFFGGLETEATTAIVRREVAAWIGDAALAIHLDVHTGLGRWGQRQLLIPDPPDSPQARWVADRFGVDVRPADGQRVYRAHGTMTEDLRDRVRPCVYHGITAEFGTYSGVRVLGMLRAENRAHFYTTPDDSRCKWAKARLLEAFAPQSIEWRAHVIESGVSLIDRAIQASV